MERSEIAPYDLIISAGHVIPMSPGGGSLPDTAVLIRDGLIRAVLPAAQAATEPAQQRIDLAGHVLMPGLINAHGHAAMSLFRGFADDTALDSWLNDHIWPAESAHVDENFVADGANLAILEMLRAGITTFSDMYFFPEAVARQALAAGMRAQLSFPILEFPSAWGRGPDDYIAQGLALRDEFKHSDWIQVAFGPHAPYTVSDKSFARVATLAAETDAPIQVHLHETRKEVEDSLSEHGVRPIRRLADLGILGPRTQCVHLCELNDEDLTILADTGSHAVHCPHSNLKLASGFSPVQALFERGVNVALGTDSAASNNRLDILAEAGLAALLAKAVSGDAAAVPASQALEMATINGARALGLEQRLGSLEPGKQADIIAVDVGQAETQPLYDPVSQLAYACTGAHVSHSWIHGRAVLLDGDAQTVDTEACLERARRWQSVISGR